MKTICLDLTNIVPGVGGVGGGIATYGKSLALGMDSILSKNRDLSSQYRFIVLLNEKTYKNLEFDIFDKYFFKINNQSLLDRMLWLQYRLPNFLKEQKVDLLHRIVSELPYRKTCKSVANVHDFMFNFYLNDSDFGKYLKFKEKIKFHILNKLLYQSLKSGDQLLVNSAAVKNEALNKVDIEPGKISVVHLGFDNKNFSMIELEESKVKEKGKIFFGIVAAFHPHKGHLNVVRLAKKMVDLGYRDQIHFYFRGSPIYQNYHEEVLGLIHKYGLTELFSFEKYDPNITLQEIYDKYSATILLSDCEGFGLPVIEAQAFHKPVICSEIPVFREILGDSAIFLSQSAKEEDIHLLFEKLFDEKFLEELIKKGITNSQQYSWTKTCSHVLDIYLDVLNRN